MSTSVTVVFFVTLPPGVRVAGDVLGTSWPVAGTPATCHFITPTPSAPPSDDGPWRGLTAPAGDHIAAAAEAFARNEAVAGAQDHDDFWGTPSQYRRDPAGLEAAHLSRAVAVTPYWGTRDREAESAFAEQTATALEQWIDSVAEWLEVLALIDVRPGLATAWQTPRHVMTVPIQVAADGSLSEFTGVVGTLYATGGGPVASLDAWRSAVSHVNAGDVPPSEHLFLRDARAATRRDQLRRAVIDAGTASEVALSKAIRQRLSDAERDTGAIDQILRTLSGVIELYDLYSVLDPPLPVSRERLRDQVAAKRNDAAHAGTTPSTVEARRSIDTVTDLLRAISPLA